MNIDSFWILTALWILPFVVNNMLRSRKRLPLDRWHNPLKVAKTELLVFTGAALNKHCVHLLPISSVENIYS